MSALPRVLVVDDKPDNLDILIAHLADSGLELVVATCGEDALHLAAERPPTLVLLDVMMPGMDGYAVCRRLKQAARTRDVPVIFMSALTDTASKVAGFEAGAIDFLSKPLQREEVLARIRVHITLVEQQRELEARNQRLLSLNRELQEQIERRQRLEDELSLSDERLSAITRADAGQWGIEGFVGRGPAATRLIEEVRSLQGAERTHVVVLGESGTGKELVSRAIHFGSARRAQPFIAVNCSAIPAELADAEFFGHRKGAYTGAAGTRHGYFQQADGGTLFLDEIGDLEPRLQAKLLRVIEDGIVAPIGGGAPRQVDVRIVAATNVDLAGRVASGRFRRDLYFRLAGYAITLPPLRERREDMPALVEHFLRLLSSQMGRDTPRIAPEALAALTAYDYPGNVRELRNLIEYALIASRGAPIEVGHLHFHGRAVTSPGTAPAAQVPAAAPPTWAGQDEQRLIEAARSAGRIDNTGAQAALGVDHARASYLLKKLHREGRLCKHGERRWSYYTVV
ncbi:MAG: sigma-54-dependent Fis family transcriptional regulator [Rhodocyclaceae bacterium]|nr:sigma-54-dependent Fis family transcriptional regulator [Rhodocyclaceae bacterium]